MSLLLALVSAVYAACPPASGQDAMAIADTLLHAASTGEPGPWNDRVSEPIQFDGIIDGAEDPTAALANYSLATTGEGPRDQEPGFMDVALVGGEVWFYLQPDRVAVIDADRRVHVRKPKARTQYAQVCGDLHDAYQAARVQGIDRRIADFEPPTAPVQAPAAPPKSKRAPGPRQPVTLGVGGAYSFAVGPVAEELVASAIGGQGYLDVELSPSFAIRSDLRYNSAEALAVELDGVAGTMTSSGFRFSPEARLRLPFANFALEGALGPSFGTYSLEWAFGGIEHSAKEFVFGAHGSAQATWRPGAGGVGLYLGADAESYLHRSNVETPIVQVGVRLGVLFGSKKEVSRAD